MLSFDDGARKRRRHNNSDPIYLPNADHFHSSIGFSGRMPGFVSEAELGPLDTQVFEDHTYVSPSSTGSQVPATDDLSLEDQTWSFIPDATMMAPDQFFTDLVNQTLSFLESSIPAKNDRFVDLSSENPFADHAEEHIPHLNPVPIALPQSGAINGYIKFRLKTSDFEEQPSPTKTTQTTIITGKTAKRYRDSSDPPPENSFVYPPPSFGMGCRLDKVDHKLFKFYLVAFCSGRTILPKTNSWLIDLGPMLAGSECLRHTLLSLASTYILDYAPSEDLRRRANRHYQKAVELLSKALADPNEQTIGKGDALIGAITLFNMHDVITWEHRRPSNQIPRWLEGARLASKILDSTDPGQRYWKAENIQYDGARISNSVTVGRAAIISLLMMPLTKADTDGQFGWLLRGSPDQVRKIHGSCGFSPKLLHMLAQITHLCASMIEDPGSTILPLGADKIKDRLRNLHQWSELSTGCKTTEELFASCVLNSDGVIDDAGKMTDLGAEAWRVAAEIYLQCRFYRLPRTHPEVFKNIDRLTGCITRMPCFGPLFTAQAPLFPVFLLGLVSTLKKDRHTVYYWFETVISATSCRSSVPPLWRSLQGLWSWMDEGGLEDECVDGKPIGERTPWWETVVKRVAETDGTLCMI